MARRAAFVNSLRGKGDHFILVDAGDFFASEGDETGLVSTVAWKEMRRLGYDAVTLGQAELARWPMVKQLLAEDSLHVVTTNLERWIGGHWEPIGNHWRIIECNGVRVGILGIIMDSEVPAWVLRAAHEDVCLLPPILTAKAAVRELADETDLTLVLLGGNDDDVARFAREVPATDIIVGGVGSGASCSRLTELPSEIGYTVVNTAGVRGQRVGVTKLIVSPRNEVVDAPGTAVTLERGMATDTLIAREVRRVLDIARRKREAPHVRCASWPSQARR